MDWFRQAMVVAGVAFGCLLVPSVRAQGEQALNRVMREEVVMVPKGEGLFPTQLETTVFRPPGQGPFPVAIINHGKAAGHPYFQARARYETAALEFLNRGYMVVLPMRQGFSKSTGNYIGGGCNVESNGLVQADDVVAVIRFLKTWADANVSKIIVVGQSHGGLTTMALGTKGEPGIKGLVNFAGGLRNESCSGWEHSLIDAFGSYGRKTVLPSLWFYGDNDSYWPIWLYQKMHTAYVNAGGKAQLVAYGPFGGDSHGMFGSRAGLPIWLGPTEKFLAELGMPFAKIHQLTPLSHKDAVPQASGFADLADVAKVPYLKEKGKEGYQKYLTTEAPKAFALSASGAWAYSSAKSDAIEQAMSRCNQFAKDAPCKLYAVDDQVVWVKE